MKNTFPEFYPMIGMFEPEGKFFLGGGRRKSTNTSASSYTDTLELQSGESFMLDDA